MNRKYIFIAVLILLTAAFSIYRFIYIPLLEKQDQLIVQLNQETNSLEDMEARIREIENLREEYRSLRKQQETDYPAPLSGSSNINDFIINIRTSELVNNVDIDFSGNNSIGSRLTLEGTYDEIYNFLSDIDYLYDTRSMMVTGEEEKIKMKLNLLFPRDVEGIQ
ncbi:MAG: hypothetical protein ACOC5A_03220 [Halanaerobiales bacterium]